AGHRRLCRTRRPGLRRTGGRRDRRSNAHVTGATGRRAVTEAAHISQNDYDSAFLTELERRILVGDGGMGTALQGHDLTLEDFAGLEGCNEILNETRPDVVRSVHQEFITAFEAEIGRAHV